MSKSSIIMLPSSQGHLNLTGDAVRADGWYGHTDGLHTVAIYLQNFQGRLRFEASIATTPTDSDWFPVEIKGSDFMSFPKDPTSPTGRTGDSGTLGLNIIGSFTWLRVRIDRSHLTPTPSSQSEIDSLGHVDRILLNN
jgi:hypothetical protein